MGMRLSLHVYLCVTNNPCPNGATCTIGDHACTNISAHVLMTLLTKIVVSHEFLYRECICMLTSYQRKHLPCQITVAAPQVSTECICSALFGNLRNFETALRKLAVAKLRANFETAYAISKLRNENFCAVYEMTVYTALKL